MAATLPTTLTPTRMGSSKDVKTRMYVNEFGEGYRQRTGDGINMINTTLNLEWLGSGTDTTALITHFEERAGYQAFTINATWNSDWGINSSWKWTCQQWNVTEIGDDVYRVTAAIRREFDLV